jgi:hypothetical protein
VSFILTFNRRSSALARLTSVRARVIAEHRKLVTTDSHSYAYQIDSQVGGSFTTITVAISPNFAVTTNNPILPTITVAASESANAYMSAREMLVSINQVFNSANWANATIRDLDIGVNASAFVPVLSGVAPNDRRVYITSTTATIAPSILPHEMGHIMMWRLMGHRTAPVERHLLKASPPSLRQLTNISQSGAIPSKKQPDSRSFQSTPPACCRRLVARRIVSRARCGARQALEAYSPHLTC